MRSKYTPLISGENITVGCVTKTAEKWMEWIKSDQEYNTPRDNAEFPKIRAHIMAAVAYVRELREGEVR